jgi:hypothetical protein
VGIVHPERTATYCNHKPEVHAQYLAQYKSISLMACVTHFLEGWCLPSQVTLTVVALDVALLELFRKVSGVQQRGIRSEVDMDGPL